MNHSTSVRRRPRRTWRAGPRPARTAAAIVAMAVLALLAAACGGSPPSTGSGGSPAAGGSATSPSALAYSACMRSQGVPNYPDPDSSGQLPKTDAQLLGVSTSRYQAAQQACRHLLPTGGSPEDCMLTKELPTGPGAADAGCRPEARPVHALPWGAELPRPHQRWCQWARFQYH